MEKTITISGKPVCFKCTGGFLIRYKEMTGRDPIQDIVKLSEVQTEDGVDYSKINTRMLFDLLWVLARTADPEVPDLLTWLDSFDEFPIGEIFPAVSDVIAGAFETTVETKTPAKKKAPKA